MCCQDKTHKGFTLVELIVVLVVLAVLSALLIPALAGYIRKAAESKVLLQARNTLVAAQSTIAEAYAKGDLVLDDAGEAFLRPSDASAHAMAKQIYELAELSEDSCEWRFSLALATDGALPAAKIDVFEFCNKQYYITYHAASSDRQSAGWGQIKVGSSLPKQNRFDNPSFLYYSDFDPDRFKG